MNRFSNFFTSLLRTKFSLNFNKIKWLEKWDKKHLKYYPIISYYISQIKRFCSCSGSFCAFIKGLVSSNLKLTSQHTLETTGMWHSHTYFYMCTALCTCNDSAFLLKRYLVFLSSLEIYIYSKFIVNPLCVCVWCFLTLSLSLTLITWLFSFLF